MAILYDLAMIYLPIYQLHAQAHTYSSETFKENVIKDISHLGVKNFYYRVIQNLLPP